MPASGLMFATPPARAAPVPSADANLHRDTPPRHDLGRARAACVRGRRGVGRRTRGRGAWGGDDAAGGPAAGATGAGPRRTADRGDGPWAPRALELPRSLLRGAGDRQDRLARLTRRPGPPAALARAGPAPLRRHHGRPERRLVRLGHAAARVGERCDRARPDACPRDARQAQRVEGAADGRHRPLRTAGGGARGGVGARRARAQPRGGRDRQRARRVRPPRLPRLALGAQAYEEEVSIYREAIAALTPGVEIAGPDVSGSGAFAEWGNAEALAQNPMLLTGHHYPLGCANDPLADHRNAAQPGDPRPRGALAGNVPRGRSRPRGPVPHGRGQLRLLRRCCRHQQHLRLGAVGGGLHRPGDGGRDRRPEPPGQPDELRGVHAALRPGPGRAGERADASRARLVRAAAGAVADRLQAGADDDRRCGRAEPRRLRLRRSRRTRASCCWSTTNRRGRRRWRCASRSDLGSAPHA